MFLRVYFKFFWLKVLLGIEACRNLETAVQGVAHMEIDDEVGSIDENRVMYGLCAEIDIKGGKL